MSGFLKKLPNSLLILLMTEEFIQSIGKDFGNTRVWRISTKGDIHLQCQGSENNTFVNSWNPKKGGFVKILKFEQIESYCRQVLSSTLFRAGMVGIVPYNLRGPGFRGSYGDIYRLLSEKHKFPLEFFVEKGGFGRFNKTTGKWNGLVGKVKESLMKTKHKVVCKISKIPDQYFCSFTPPNPVIGKFGCSSEASFDR